MKLFNKRPLCLILCIMLGGFYFSASVGVTLRIVLIGTSLALLVISFIIKGLLIGRKAFARICICALLFSAFLGTLWSHVYYPSDYDGMEVCARGIVLDADHTDTSESCIILKTDEINGKPDRHRVRITGDKDTLSGINVGDEISLTLTISSLSANDAVTATYYVGRGYSATSRTPSDVTLLSRENFTVKYHFDTLRSRVADRFRIITNKDTGDFLAALLMGERDVLDGQTELNFLRTGTSHILALSGAHLVILAYAMTMLLKMFRLNNKIRTVIITVFVFLYMLLTGMSACVTRAGVMLIITSLVYLLAHRSDGITSLTLSICTIVLFQPFAIYDISLWLSAFATLGLIYLSVLTNKRGKEGGFMRKALRALLIATLASVFAISASFILCLLSFDSFSPLTVIATLILTPLTEVIIYLGMIGLLVGTVIPIGVPIIYLTEFTKDITAFMAEPSFALIPFDYLPVKLLGIILAALFFGFIIFGEPKRPKTAIITLSVAFILLNAVGITQHTIVRHSDTVVYRSDTSSNLVAVRSEGELGIIATGGGKYATAYPRALASEINATNIDHLILPSYTYFTIQQIRETASSIKTDTVYLPRPETSGELVLAEQLAELLSKFSARLKFYSEDEPIAIGEATYFLCEHSYLDSSVRTDAFLLTYGEKSIAYLSADNLDYFNTRVTALIDGADLLIIGGEAKAKEREISILPKNADTVYLGAAFTVSDEMREYLEESDKVLKYAEKYEIIE